MAVLGQNQKALWHLLSRRHGLGGLRLPASRQEQGHVVSTRRTRSVLVPPDVLREAGEEQSSESLV